MNFFKAQHLIVNITPLRLIVAPPLFRSNELHATPPYSRSIASTLTIAIPNTPSLPTTVEYTPHNPWTTALLRFKCRSTDGGQRRMVHEGEERVDGTSLLGSNRVDDEQGEGIKKIRFFSFWFSNFCNFNDDDVEFKEYNVEASQELSNRRQWNA